MLDCWMGNLEVGNVHTKRFEIFTKKILILYYLQCICTYVLVSMYIVHKICLHNICSMQCNMHVAMYTWDWVYVLCIYTFLYSIH